MKYRVKSHDESMQDFEDEADAMKEFGKRKARLRRARIVDGVRPMVSIHRCYHEEGLSCKGQEIDRYEK